MNTQGSKLGTLPDKELELLRDADQQLSTKTSRFALIQVALLAFIVFAFAKAFRQVDDVGASEKLEDIRILAKITHQSAWDLGADPILDFFVLRDLVYQQSSNNKEAQPGEREEARRVLTKYIPSFQEVGQSPIPKDQEQAMQNQQKKLASEISKAYRDAFGARFTLADAKIVFDLRNWAVFLFPLFLLSEIYLLILRKKQRLIQMVAAHRVQSLRVADPGAVATMDLMTFCGNHFNATAFTRYPGQITDWVYVMAVVGFLIFSAITSKGFWWSLQLDVLVIITLILLLGTSHAIAYYIYVSNRLKEQIQNQTNLSFAGCFDAICLHCSRWARRVAGYRIPRFWLSTGSGLILLSLFMAVGVDSCGGSRRGYEVVRGYALERESNRSVHKVTMWFPVYWEMLRKDLLIKGDDWWSRPVTTGFERFIRSHWLIARGAYTATLSLGGITLLLVFISFRYGWALANRPVSWFLRVLGALLLFMITDVYFFFLLPPMRIAILSIYWLFPMVLWFWFGFLKNQETSQGRQILRTVLQVVSAPLVTWTLILSFMIGLGLFCLLIGCGLVCFGYIQLNSPAAPQQTPSA